MVIILLIGGIVLFATSRQQEQRLKLLEAELGSLRALLAALPERAVEPVSAPEPEAIVAPMPAHQAVAETPILPVVSPHPEPEFEPAQAEPADVEPARESLAALFERFVAGRLLIWVGGIALAVSGVFLVRYSIQLGLIGPRVRMILAAAFGLALIAAGEAARRRPDLAGDARVAQALVGAGIFVLYATTYGALTLYGLISLGVASVLMALITAGALLMSLRHGAPTAVMGLVGGFLTPALVGDPDSSAVPLLFYLGLLNLGLFSVAFRRGWTWLAAAAVIFSFLWTGPLLLVDARDDAIAAGIFIVVIAVAASLVQPGTGRQLRLVQPAMIGLVQLAFLVARVDIDPAAWALFGALSLACLALAVLRAEHRWLPVAALGLALLMLAGETFVPDREVALVVAPAISLLFAGVAVPMALRGRDRLLWTGIACAGLAGPVLILRLGEGDLLAPLYWGAIVAALGLGLAVLAWALSRRPDRALTVAASTATLLLMVAITDWVGERDLAPSWLLVGLAVAGAGRRLRGPELAAVAAAVALCAVLAAVAHTGPLWLTVQLALAGEPAYVTNLPRPLDALLALLLPAALLVLLWRLLADAPVRVQAPVLWTALVLALGGSYVLYKQLFALGDLAGFAERGFAERAVLNQLLFAAGWLLAWRRLGPPLLATIFTALAAGRLIWFDLLLHNPLWERQQVGALPVLNLILLAFGGAAIWLWLERRRADPKTAQTWLGLFLVALVAGTALLVRQSFQGAYLNGPELPIGESYGYSLGGLLLSIALLIAGVRLADGALRVAGLALLTATICKVFLVDAGALDGLLRILSFLGLGVALIGVNKLYVTVLKRERTGMANAVDAGGKDAPPTPS